MAEAKLNRLKLTEKDYDGAASTMCKGCGHDAISASVQRAYFESSIDPRQGGQTQRHRLLVENSGLFFKPILRLQCRAWPHVRGGDRR